MSESLSVDQGWEESLDSDQVTHVKGDAAPAAALAGEWLVNTADQVVVPMTTTDIVEALRTRRLGERSLVWRLGMQDWAPLADVPPLRLAAGRFATPAAGTPAQHPPNKAHAAAAKAAPATKSAPAPAIKPAAAAAAKPASTTRSLHPPPKEAARAARDERRRNTLPFGFPVVRDPATIREPAGLQAATSAPRSEASAPSSKLEDSNANALAVYERAAPSLTFADSVRAEWEGPQKIVHQHAASPAPSVPVAPIKPIMVARPEPKPEARPQPKPELLPKIEPKPRLSLEPQSDPKPRLSLEPQSDPLQISRGEPHQFGKMLPLGGSLAPTTTDPQLELPQRGAGMWGDLSVVLASDLRAAQASSKRITWAASIGSALLASALTLWFAHSPTHAAPEAAAAAQAPAALTPAKPELFAAPTATATPTMEPNSAAAPSNTALAHAASAPSATATPTALASVHVAPKPAPPRVVAIAKPKAAPSVAVDGAGELSPNADANPYADAPERKEPKTPTAAFKETSDSSSSSNENKPAASNTVASKPAVLSGLEDSAAPVRPAPTAAPGF